MCFVGCDVYQNGEYTHYEGDYPDLGDYEANDGDYDYESHDLAVDQAMEDCYRKAQNNLVSA